MAVNRMTRSLSAVDNYKQLRRAGGAPHMMVRRRSCLGSILEIHLTIDPGPTGSTLWLGVYQ